MSPGTPTRVIAASCGLSGFAVAIIAGLMADNPTENILIHGIAALFVCNFLGWVIGGIAERTVRDSIESSSGLKDVNRLSTDKSASSTAGAPISATS